MRNALKSPNVLGRVNLPFDLFGDFLQEENCRVGQFSTRSRVCKIGKVQVRVRKMVRGARSGAAEVRNAMLI